MNFDDRTDLHLGTRLVLTTIGSSPYTPTAKQIAHRLGVGRQLSEKIHEEILSTLVVANHTKSDDLQHLSSSSSSSSVVVDVVKEEERFELRENLDPVLDRLNGIRGSTTDFVQRFVAPEQQRGFLGALEMLKEGRRPGLFKQDDGTTIEDRSSVIATALNRLLVEGLRKNEDVLKAIKRAVRYEVKYWDITKARVENAEALDLPDDFAFTATQNRKREDE